MKPKCPHCGNVLMSVNLEELDGNVHGQSRWKCTSYSCPVCQKLLSVQVDPVALKADILEGVKELLRTR